MYAEATTYAYSVAYVKALKSKLLSGGSLEALVKARDEQEAIRALLETPYGPFVERLVGVAFTPADLDGALFGAYNDAYMAVMRAAYRTPAEELLRLTYRKHEYECLKVILRSVFEGRPPEESIRIISPVGDYTHDRCLRLLRSRNLDEVVADVDDSRLRSRLSQAVRDSLKARSTLPAESTIERHHFDSVWQILRKLRRADQRHVRRILGAETDIANIMILLRGKELKLSREVLAALAIDARHRLGDEFDRALAAPSTLDAIRILAEGYYSKPLTEGLELMKAGGGLAQAELKLRGYLAQVNLSAFVGYPFHAGILQAYLNLKFFELQDVRAVILGKRDKIPEDDVRRMLMLLAR